MADSPASRLRAVAGMLPGSTYGFEYEQDHQVATASKRSSLKLPGLENRTSTVSSTGSSMCTPSDDNRVHVLAPNSLKVSKSEGYSSSNPGMARSKSRKIKFEEEAGPRLKDEPGLYRIKAEEGVSVSKYLPGLGQLQRKSTTETCKAALGLASGAPWWCCCLKRKRKRLFNRQKFEVGEIVRVAEINTTARKGHVYGKVVDEDDDQVVFGWIPLLEVSTRYSYADKVSLKEQIQMSLDKPVYDVMNYYKERGVWQAIARSSIFENVTLFVITVNAFWMWYDADENSAHTLLEAQPVFQIAEHVFCVFFSFEWFVRFMAFEKKSSGLGDRWFVFDSCLVGMMVFETWFMTALLIIAGAQLSGGGGSASLLRLLRLLRLSRLARMLRSMPELMIMIKGIVAAFRTVTLAIVLLVILMYIFAIMFRQLTGGTSVGRKYFSNMGHAMYTLLVNGTFLEDLYTVINALGAASPFYAGIFFVFILLSALTVMNMLIGILCEVVSGVAKVEKEQMLMDFVSSKMQEIMQELKRDLEGKITKNDFQQIITKPEAVRILAETGVDVRTLVDYTDFIFEAEDGEDRVLSLKQFMDVVLSFRTSNTATVKDAVDIRKWIGKSFKRLDDMMKHAIALHQPSKASASCFDVLMNCESQSAPLNGSLFGPKDQEPANCMTSLQRLDAFFAALAGELALLSADLAEASEGSATGSWPAPRQVPSVVLIDTAFPPEETAPLPLGVRPDTPLDDPPAGVPVSRARTVDEEGELEMQETRSEELSSRVQRLQHYSELAWSELQRLDSSNPSFASPPPVRLWRCCAEEFLLAAWTDGMERLRQAKCLDTFDSTEVRDMQGFVSSLLGLLRLRQSTLRTLLSSRGQLDGKKAGGMYASKSS